jgi:hypothetical protein
MQTIEFLRNFFTKGLEIHSSFFIVFFQFFSKKIQFQNKKFGIWNFSNLKFKKSPNFEPVPKG